MNQRQMGLAKRASGIARLLPTSRLGLFLLLILWIVLTPVSRLVWLIPPVIMLMGISWAAATAQKAGGGGLRLNRLLRRFILLEPFVLGVSVLVVFQPDGWQRAGALVLRGSLSLWAMILLSETIAFGELLKALRALRMPALLVNTIALMHRYGFVLIEESSRMRRARHSRTFIQGRAREWRMQGNVAGQLFVRAFDRAERVHAAMCARGWNVSGD